MTRAGRKVTERRSCLAAYCFSMPVEDSRASEIASTRAHDLAHVEQLFERLGLARVVRQLPARALWAAYVFGNGFLSIALLALLAVVTGVPFVFPSLGPTAYQLFFLPRAESSTPRNTLIGHFIGLVCGYMSFRVARMPIAAVLASSDLDWRPVVAAGLSLAITAAIMILFDASHPPAGATTLIVSLGIITKPPHLAIIEIAVFVLTVQAFCVHRLAKLPYPIWKSPQRIRSRIDK
jgi:CBS domain-containing membrane protein